MAKQKALPEDEDLTFLGQSIDPEVEKRVQDFMEADVTDELPGQENGADESLAVNKSDLGSELTDSVTAPLLPTDKLPDIAKTPHKSIKVVDDSDTSSVENQPLATAPVLVSRTKEKVIEPLSSDIKGVVVHDFDEEVTTSEINLETIKDPVSKTSKKIAVLDDQSINEASEEPKNLLKPKKTKRAKTSTTQKAAKLTKKSKKIIPLSVAPEEATEATEETLSAASSVLQEEEKLQINESEPEKDEIADDKLELANEEIEQLSDENEQDLTSDVAPEEVNIASAGDYEKLDYGQTIEEAESSVEPTVVPKVPEIINDSSTPMDDTATSEAIDDIIASDADEILGIEDQKRAKSHYHSPKDDKSKVTSHKKNHKSRQESWLKTWWTLPLYRNLTFLTILLGLLVALYFPVSRYKIMNLLGFRASSSLRVVDSKNNMPIKNIDVRLADKQAKTDQNGEIKLEKLKLGKQKLIITSPAFAEVSQEVELDWGSNQLKDVQLKATGVQVYFQVTDYVSNQPLKDVNIVYSDYNAKTDDKGNAILVLPKINKDQIEVAVTANSYRDEKLNIKPVDNPNQSYKQTLTPAKKHAFVSKRSGKYDLYKVDVDGKDEQVVLAGTGLEKPDSLALSISPTKNMVAFSSNRDNKRGEDGNLMSTLNLVNLDSKEVKQLAISERIQIIDWFGSRLVYVKISEGSKKDDINRHKIVSYDTQTNKEQELASSNYFNDVVVANGSIYYAPAAYKVNGNVGLYKINPDGSAKKTVLSNEVWNLIRSSFEKVSVSVGQDWYDLNLANDAMTKVGSPPPSVKSRLYIANPNNKQDNLWVDERDGKPVLLNYQVSKKSDQTVLNETGLRNPIYWLSEKHVVYRISSGSETADYVYSLDGGQPKRIKDVVNTAGADRWYYFN